MSDNLSVLAADPVDPDVRRFVSAISEGYGQFPSFDALTPPEARRVAEEVRASWREGGPQMARTREIEVPHGDAGVRVRIYEPATNAEGLRPALVYLHGGGFCFFSLDTHDRLMREYAGRSGLTVIGVDYALAPEAKFPFALGQVKAVVRWLRAEGSGLGVDPGRIAIGGDSAGGNLSTVTALALRDEGDGEALRGLLLNYAAFDGDCSDAAAERWGGAGFMLTREELHAMWSNYRARPEDAADPLFNPMLADLSGLPPVFLVVAECDVLTEQNLEMADRLRAAGVETRIEIYRGATHSFLEAMSISRLAERAIDDSVEWLQRVTER